MLKGFHAHYLDARDPDGKWFRANIYNICIYILYIHIYVCMYLGYDMIISHCQFLGWPTSRSFDVNFSTSNALWKMTVFESSRSWPDLIRNAVSACSKAKYFGTVITTMGWWENRKHPKSGGKKPWVFCSSLKAMNSRWEWGDMGKYVRSKYIVITDVLHPKSGCFQRW